jgi:hypothetical protein
LAWSLTRKTRNTFWFGLIGALQTCEISSLPKYFFHTLSSSFSSVSVPTFTQGEIETEEVSQLRNLFILYYCITAISILLLFPIPSLREALRSLDLLLHRSKREGEGEAKGSTFRTFSKHLVILYLVQLLQSLAILTPDALSLAILPPTQPVGFVVSIHLRHLILSFKSSPLTFVLVLLLLLLLLFSPVLLSFL